MKKEDFKQYVKMALNATDLATMRPVVEKELMHYEIFNALDEGVCSKIWCFKAEHPCGCAVAPNGSAKTLTSPGAEIFLPPAWKRSRTASSSESGIVSA
jgi:hypothetical protein